MKLDKLRKQFKAANRRVDKAFTRYKKALLPLYIQINDNAAPRYVSAYDNSVIQGRVANFATDYSWTFYRRGRGGKFYEKQQPKPSDQWTQELWEDYAKGQQLVGQDYLDLLKLETAIDTAVDERERLLNELESAGVNPYAENELWQ